MKLKTSRPAALSFENRDIATQWVISIKTVESHRENLKKKLGLSAGVDWCEAAAKFVNSLIEGGRPLE